MNGASCFIFTLCFIPRRRRKALLCELVLAKAVGMELRTLPSAPPPYPGPSSQSGLAERRRVGCSLPRCPMLMAWGSLGGQPGSSLQTVRLHPLWKEHHASPALSQLFFHN